jgi:dihydrofolate synthase/folylpolyglutamate synthase
MASDCTFEVVEERLQKLASPGIRPGLARLSKLLLLLGNPQHKFRAVHIVGTNGKGSTAVSVYMILLGSGYKTALYTSPHLVSFGERLNVNGKTVVPAEWIKQIAKIDKIIDKCQYLKNNRPTYFELITAAAFMIIAEENVDVAVVEAGMGGRLDATNIMTDVIMTLITPIGLDHIQFLGNTLIDIAAEKFAVVRKGVPAIFAGGENADLEKAFISRARLISAIPYILPHYCHWSTESVTTSGTTFNVTIGSNACNFHTPLIGAYQADNSALAVAAASLLMKYLTKINTTTIKKGLESVSWPGRFEIISNDPIIIFDGAHNSHAMKRLVEALNSLSMQHKPSIVIAMMKDKDIRKSLEILKPLEPEIYCTQVPDMPRSMSADKLSEIAADIELHVLSTDIDPLLALQKAKTSGKAVICCGSLYFVGWLKKHYE